MISTFSTSTAPAAPLGALSRAVTAQACRATSTCRADVDAAALTDALRQLPGHLVTLTTGVASNLRDDELWLAAGRQRARVPATIRSGDTGVRLTTDRRDLLDALDATRDIVGATITLSWTATLPALAQA